MVEKRNCWVVERHSRRQRAEGNPHVAGSVLWVVLGQLVLGMLQPVHSVGQLEGKQGWI